MTWFAEDPLVIWLAAAVLFTAVLIVYFQTGQRWSLLAMAVVVLLAGGLTLLEQVLVTPREAVRQTLREVFAAVEKSSPRLRSLYGGWEVIMPPSKKNKAIEYARGNGPHRTKGQGCRKSTNMKNTKYVKKMQK